MMALSTDGFDVCIAKHAKILSFVEHLPLDLWRRARTCFRMRSSPRLPPQASPATQRGRGRLSASGGAAALAAAAAATSLLAAGGDGGGEEDEEEEEMIL